MAAIEKARPKRAYKKRTKKNEKAIGNCSQNVQIELVTNKFLDGGDTLTQQVAEPPAEAERGASFYLNDDNEPLNVHRSPQHRP